MYWPAVTGRMLVHSISVVSVPVAAGSCVCAYAMFVPLTRNPSDLFPVTLFAQRVAARTQYVPLIGAVYRLLFVTFECPDQVSETVVSNCTAVKVPDVKAACTVVTVKIAVGGLSYSASFASASTSRLDATYTTPASSPPE